MAEGRNGAGTAEEKDTATEGVCDVNKAGISTDDYAGRLDESNISIAGGVDDAGWGDTSHDKATTILVPSAKKYLDSVMRKRL